MTVRPKILIVEDNADLRGLFRTALSVAGFEVREAADGLEALQALDQDPPDLVVLDLRIPMFSGHVVRDELASNALTREIPVVVVTALTGLEVDRVRADCVLTKRVSPEELVRTVRQCLRST